MRPNYSYVAVIDVPDSEQIVYRVELIFVLLSSGSANLGRESCAFIFRPDVVIVSSAEDVIGEENFLGFVGCFEWILVDWGGSGF